MNRRNFLKDAAFLAASAATLPNVSRGQAQAAQATGGALVMDPKPLFDISPHLYMQFMDPLGVTDSSLEAAWDDNRQDGRKDFIDATKDLAPDMIHYRGLRSRYDKWREGGGPAGKRPPYRNYVWDGWETHRVGTHEFADFCRRVNTEPMYCVNFLGDGEKRDQHTPQGNRTGDARQAADWVSYTNDPEHARSIPMSSSPREHVLPAGESLKWRFPARSVSVVELECRAA